jgi:drug/metabolite transporter (DMT)-like permease
MTWLIVTISSYFLFAAVSLTDKHLLTKSIPNPRVYAFYVGILGILAIILAPFVGFYVPGIFQIILGILAGVFFVFSLFWFYKGLSLFEASRIIPAIGGMTPLFTVFFVYVFSKGKESFSFIQIIALLLLVLGSVLISYEKGKFVNSKSLKISFAVAFLGSLSFVLTKYLYMALPFWTGFIWKAIGGFLTAVSFYFIFPEIKKEIFKKKEKSPKKTAFIFLLNQAGGAIASVLQNWALALAPLAYISFINAAQGVQYAFLLILSVILSLKFPKILKEEVSRGTIFQKIIAIFIIGAGIAILAIF